MPSFFDFLGDETTDRRHSTPGHIQTGNVRRSSATPGSGTRTPPSDRQWRTAVSSLDHGRSNSVVSTGSTKSAESAKSEHRGFFGRHKDKSQKKEEKIVLTSKHAGAVKNKLAHDPKLHHPQQVAPVQRVTNGHQDLSHMSAESLEMRHPHSGPVALRRPPSHHDADDMPSLTRIDSYDEPDNEDQWQRLRREWNTDKIPEVTLEHMTPATSYTATPPLTAQSTRTAPLPSTESSTPTPALSPTSSLTAPSEDGHDNPSKVVDVGGTNIVGANIDYHKYQPKATKPRTPGIRYSRNESGAWKRGMSG